MRKQVAAHIGFDFGTHDVADRSHKIVCDRVDHTENYVDDRAMQNKSCGKGADVVSSPACDLAHDHWENKLTKRGKSSADKVKDHNRQVLFIIWQKAS